MREEFSTVVVIDQLRNALESLRRDAQALSGGSSLAAVKVTIDDHGELTLALTRPEPIVITGVSS